MGLPPVNTLCGVPESAVSEAEPRTLRDWPFAVGSFLSGLVMLAFAAGLANLPATTPQGWIALVVFAFVFGAFGACALVGSVRSRVRLDAAGFTVFYALAARRVEWSRLEHLEVESNYRYWVLRAHLSAGTVTVLERRRSKWGRAWRPWEAQVSPTPPENAPHTLHRYYAAIDEAWDAAEAAADVD